MKLFHRFILGWLLTASEILLGLLQLSYWSLRKKVLLWILSKMRDRNGTCGVLYHDRHVCKRTSMIEIAFELSCFASLRTLLLWFYIFMDEHWDKMENRAYLCFFNVVYSAAILEGFPLFSGFSLISTFIKRSEFWFWTPALVYIPGKTSSGV